MTVYNSPCNSKILSVQTSLPYTSSNYNLKRQRSISPKELLIVLLSKRFSDFILLTHLHTIKVMSRKKSGKWAAAKRWSFFQNKASSGFFAVSTAHSSEPFWTLFPILHKLPNWAQRPLKTTGFYLGPSFYLDSFYQLLFTPSHSTKSAEDENQIWVKSWLSNTGQKSKVLT